MYSFQSKTESIIFVPRQVNPWLYIWFTIKFSSNESSSEKKNVVIHDFKTRYMLWPGIKYSMYIIQSKSASIIFIPRRIRARLYIYSSQLSSIGTYPQAKQNVVFGDLKTHYMLWPGIKYPMYSLKS
jgi:hypothetical protein